MRLEHVGILNNGGGRKKRRRTGGEEEAKEDTHWIPPNICNISNCTCDTTDIFV